MIDKNMDGANERLRHRELRIWGHDINNFEDDFKNDVIIFPTVKGTHIPVEPWPIRFIVSKDMTDEGYFIVRKLTLRYLALMALQNMVTTVNHFFKLCMYRIGFLNSNEPFEVLSFSHFTPKFLSERQKRMKKFNTVQISYATLLASMNIGWRPAPQKPSKDKGHEGAWVDDDEH